MMLMRFPALSKLMVWLGCRTKREVALLWIVWIAVLAYFLGNHLVMDAWRNLDRERIRLQASEVSMSNLEDLLDQRDEIMRRAEGLMVDYLQSQELEASTLLLKRLDRSRAEDLELVSVYPLGGQANQAISGFRVNLAGTSGEIGRLLFALGEGAPPIILRELSLSAERSTDSRLTCATSLEIEQQSLPDEWIQLLAELTDKANNGDEDEDDSASTNRRRAIEDEADFPYKSIDRRDVFKARRKPRKRRMEKAGPTIRTLIKDLTFLGVIGDEDPTAIISDRDSRTTNYRKVGQFIGELEVIEITRNSVVMRYKDEEERLK